MARRHMKKSNLKTVCLVILPALIVFGVILALINLPLGSRATSKLLNVVKSAGAREVTWLIRAGADVNDDNFGGWTPLLLAAANNPNPDVPRVLIEKGADVDAVFDDGMTPLMMAARYNSNPDILRILLEKDANVGIRDWAGLRALDYAEENAALRGTDTYSLLVEKTMPILLAGERNTNELLAFAHELSVEGVSRLVHEGADVNAVGIDGLTPLMQAAGGNSNLEVLRVLLENGADVYAVCDEGFTPLMYAARDNPNPEILRLLIENGADVNAIGRDGYTSLMYAARNNPNPEILGILLENGADVNAVCGYENTSLVYAAKFNPNPETVILLIENDADVSMKNRGGFTAFDVAEDNEMLIGTNAYEFLREKTLGSE